MTDKLCARPVFRGLTWAPEGDGRAEMVERVIAICERCPSQATCLAEATDRREPFGVWGGKDFSPPPRARKPKKKVKKKPRKPRVRKIATPTGDHGCPLCPRSFRTLHGLRGHRGTEHPGEIVPLEISRPVAA